MTRLLRVVWLGFAAAVFANATLALAAPAPSPRPIPEAIAATWSARNPRVAEDLRAGRPLVTVLEVPLCSNRQVRCGGGGAGDPESLDKNLYWGRGFGVRRYWW